MIIGSLSFPWYLNQDVVIFGNMNCTRYLLTSWQREYCSTQGDACKYIENIFQCGKSDNDNWRNQCNGKCDHRKKLYDITGVTCGISVIGCCILFLGFLIRCLCEEKNRNSVMMIISLIGFISLVTSILYFSFNAVSAVRDDFDGKCPSFEEQALYRLHGPCDSLVGSKNISLSFGQMALRRFWTPWVGYGVAVVATSLYIIVMCISFSGQRQPQYDDSYKKVPDTQYV